MLLIAFKLSQLMERGMLMIKKYFPLVIIVLLGCYAIFDFLLKEEMLETEVSSEQEILDEPSKDTSDDLAEASFIESSQTTPKIEVAPSFELSDLTGATINLSDFKGKIVILNFWASWCPPCREEMPHMQSFYEKNKENDIEIIAVNLTNLDSGQQAIEQFVQDYGLTFPVLLDEKGNVGIMYEIMTIPTSYILDAEGRIFQKIIGSMDEQIMDDIVNAIRMYDQEHGE